MPKLPVLTAREFKKKIRKIGFEYYRDAAGSHEIWWEPTTGRRVVIAVHPGKTIKKKTLRKMMREVGISIKEFVKL